MLQPLSHHITATQVVSPEGTQDGDKGAVPCQVHLAVSCCSYPLTVHPEETQGEKTQDTAPR